MSRVSVRIAIALAVSAPLIAMYAGGWATVSVQNLPDYIIAGQPTNVTFAIRQHGDELLSDLSPHIVASSGKDTFKARAVETNRNGFYTATLNAPRTGDWTVTIHSGFGRSKITLLPIAAVASSARPAVFTDAQRGHRLFAARSCMTCHAHARVPESGYVKAGPDLTSTNFPQEYLQRFLADPSIRPATEGRMRMPNPDLGPDEINALVAFLTENQAGRQASR